MWLHYLGWDLAVLPHAGETLGLWEADSDISHDQRHHRLLCYVSKIREHSVSPRMVFWPHCCQQTVPSFLITCGKAVLDPEANPLQLVVTEEADPHEASTGEDQPWTGSSTEAIDERRETEGAIPHLDVVETTLEWGLDVEFIIKQQLYPLTGQCWRKQSDVSHWQSQRWFRDTILLDNRCSKSNSFQLS